MLNAVSPGSLDDLAGYLEDMAEPPVRLAGLAREVWERAALLMAPSDSLPFVLSAPPAFAKSGITSAAFIRMMDVPGPLLAGIVDVWWQRRSGRAEAAGDIAVGPLTLSQHGVRGRLLWIDGWLTCPRRSRGIPVSIELWPHSGSWTRVAMQPTIGLTPSRRYFIAGHAGLDQLSAEFAEQVASLEPAEPLAPSS